MANALGGSELPKFWPKFVFTKSFMARATVVFLDGPTAHQPYSFALGRYERQQDLNQQRHVYTSSDSERAIWWQDGAWYCGTKASIGKRMGFMQATENTDVPEDVSVVWRVSAGSSKWDDVPEVKCVTEEVHAALDSAM